ncbi:MAG: S8 family serine peptidase [Deltaproteobacteria bacterium]|nr:MAG: S8 family serine peptidase [Deltaproteobacteria bacterium]
MLWGTLGDQLLAALTAYENGDANWAKAGHIPHDRVIEDRLILTAFDYDYEGQKRDFPALLTEHGAKVTPGLDPRAIEIELPISHLRELSQYVAGLEITGYTYTAEKSAGWAGTNASWWHLTGHVTGNGQGGDGRPVTIAIVDEFDSRLFPDLISRGLIPPGTTITDDLARAGVYGSDHGNQMLQLLYEIAPQARFVLINMDNRFGSLGRGISAAIHLNPDIISTSVVNNLDRKLGQFKSYPGPVEEMHAKAYDSGILVIAAAGNTGAPGYHWSGFFVPSTRYPLLSNWNVQAATLPNPSEFVNVDLPETSHVTGEVVVNDMGCILSSDSSDIPIRIDAGLSPETSKDYVVSLVKYIPSERGWRTVLPNTGYGVLYESKRFFSYLNVPSETISGELIQSDIPSTNCPTNSDRYGIVLEKTAELSDREEATYLNLFTYYNTLRIYNTAASLSESNTYRKSVTVGAAGCTAPVGSGCPVQGPLPFSARGPAVERGLQPHELERTFLTLESRTDETAESVKPDFVAPAPPLRGSSSLDSGTSGATALTSGMAALLLDRYPYQFRRNPPELKAALLRLAERSVGLQSTYVRFSENPNDPRYGEVRTSYKYGRGYLKLEKENTVYMRGRPNHVRLNQNMTSSPRTARTVNGTETFLPASESPPSMSLIYRFADGIGPQPVFYLTGETGGVRVGASTPDTIDTGVPTRMLYPVLKPVVVFDPTSFGGAAGARGAMFMGGTNSTQLFPSNLRFSSSYLDAQKTAGYFSFPSLQFTANPTASPMIGQMFSLTMRAARRDGTLVPTDSTQATSDYNAALSAAQARMMRDGTPIDYLSLGCTNCFVRQNTTATFNTCQMGYRPSLADTCPTTP